MNKIALVICCFALIFVNYTSVSANADGCVTIQDGTLLTSEGIVIVPGFDQWGCMFSKGFGQIRGKNKRGFRSQIPSFYSLSNL